MTRILSVIFTCLLLPTFGFGAFTHYKAFTIGSGQISGTLSNFAVLINETDNDFRTIGNGGCVANSNGYDIRPYADSSATTALDFELVAGTYSPTTGKFEMHIRVSSAAVGSVIYLFCGDTGLTTNGSSTGTWDSNYKLVIHFGDGTTLSANDSTSNGNNFTNNSATANSGQIAGGGAFSSASLTRASISGVSGDYTFSFWSNAGNYQTGYMFDALSGRLVVGDDGNAPTADSLSFYDGTWRSIGSARTDGVTYHNALTLNSGSSTATGYQNGSSLGTTSYTTVSTLNTELAIGSIHSGTGTFMNGWLDEFRISNIVRSAAWIAAEYNNQSNPANFTDKGSLTAIGGGGGIAGVQSKAFTAGSVNDSIIDVAFDSNNTAGNFIFAVISYCSTSACNNDGTFFTKTITDTRGNTYNQTNCVDDDSANHVVSCGYYARNIGAGANTVTSTLTDMGGLEAWYHTIIVMEFSGVSTASDVLDQVNKNIGTSADGSVSTSSSTTQTNELVVGFMVGPSGSATVGSGYTLISNTGHLTAEYKVVSSTGTQTATWVHSSERWKANINTFKGASGGGAGGTGAPLILRLGL